MKRAKNLLKWLNLLLILVTFVAYLSPYINPEKFWLIAVLGTGYPWLLFANFIFVITWLVFKNKYFLFSLACIILGWNHFTNFIGFNFQSTTKPADLKVLSFNAHGMKYLKYKKKYADIKKQKTKELFNFLYSKGKPDIFCTQEINNYHAQGILDQLDYPYHHRIPYIGTAVFSKYPIVEKGWLDFKTNVNSCIWADLKIEDQTIRVYNIHLQSNQVSDETDKVISEGQIKEKETWSNIKNILAKYKHASQIRVRQAIKIAAHIAKSPYPVIVCGDFNDTPQSYVYRIISEGMLDTFKEKGMGLGSTYAGKIPALRIDYILSSKKFEVLNNYILKKPYSDHYPVFSTLSIN